MSCVESMPPTFAESEREEGEIVDELDELSDISSEEEYLMRQRLQVLESYNHVLERKQAKRSSSVRPGKRKVNDVQTPSGDVSDISTTNLDDMILSPRINKDVRQSKPIHHKHKRKKESLVRKSSVEQPLSRYKDHRRKPHKLKKKFELKSQSASSDESDYEYRSKRRKLANAVSVKKGKTDSTLKARLMKMLCQTQNIGNPMIVDSIEKEMKLAPGTQVWNMCSYAELPEEKDNTNVVTVDENNQKLVSELATDKLDTKHELIRKDISDKKKNITEEAEIIDSSSDGLELVTENNEPFVMDINDPSIISIASNKTEEASDEDLESLRQHALKSKVSKQQDQISKIDIIEPSDKKGTENYSKPVLQSEDEDSDTAELRLICLRSALLKKAIEMKQKQKLRKRLSQSTTLYEDIISNDHDMCSKSDIDNNTDIESVDMDIGSDAAELDDKGNISNKPNDPTNDTDICEIESHREEKLNIPKNNEPKVDDLDDDEDLLRAKLLTSLSKSLPLKTLLINPDTIQAGDVQNIEMPKNKLEKRKNVVSNVPQEKRFIINTGGSDSEGEHEATKNLTKMHMKLSEQVDFQQKLDMFLKSARLEVEKKELPDVVQQPQLMVPLPKTPEKFVPKAVNHLPKSEQIEYKNLVKRMTELEKMKQSRQLTINTLNNKLKPRKVTIDDEMKNAVFSNLDEQISMSRKMIAEESAKVLQLKEEGAKLLQKYKIVATELRNLSTAISLNKKHQNTSQAKLARTRAQHQQLLKRSNMTVRNTLSLRSVNTTHKKVTLSSNVQKENETFNEEIDPLKAVKVSVVNDYKPEAEMNEHTLSVQIDVASNKQTVTMPKKSNPAKEFACGGHRTVTEKDDYESPLQALSSEGWDEDPNGVLCPFEVAGSCKDSNCKYLHPKPTH